MFRPIKLLLGIAFLNLVCSTGALALNPKPSNYSVFDLVKKCPSPREFRDVDVSFFQMPMGDEYGSESSPNAKFLFDSKEGLFQVRAPLNAHYEGSGNGYWKEFANFVLVQLAMGGSLVSARLDSSGENLVCSYSAAHSLHNVFSTLYAVKRLR